MAITVLKNTFPKAKPKVVHYRDYKNFVLCNFGEELKSRLENEVGGNYAKFETTFLQILDKHAPLKK